MHRDIKCYDEAINVNSTGRMMLIRNVSCTDITIDGIYFSFRNIDDVYDIYFELVSEDYTDTIKVAIGKSEAYNEKRITFSDIVLKPTQSLEIKRITSKSTIRMLGTSNEKIAEVNRYIDVESVSAGFRLSISGNAHTFSDKLYINNINFQGNGRRHFGDYEDRDWYMNTDIWEYPLLYWLKKIPIGKGSNNFNIFVKHLGDIKKVNKVFVYKGGSFIAVKDAYVLKDNTFKKV